MKKWIIMICTSLVIFGCVSTKRNYAQEASSLSLGISKQEVINTLGPPNKSSMRKSNGDIVESLVYWSPTVVGFTVMDNEMMANDRVTIVIVNGKVNEWGDMMSMDRIMEKSMEQQAKIMQNLPKQQPAEIKVTIEK